jgi:hypothetical protein
MSPTTTISQWYRPLWIGLAALLVCVGTGYAIGTKVAVNTLFNGWMIVTGILATRHMIRFKDHRIPGAVPALVIWTLWFGTVLVLGGMVFGEKCPLVRIPQLGTPGVE